MWKRIKLWYWKFEERMALEDLQEIHRCMAWLKPDCRARARIERRGLRKRLLEVRLHIAELDG